MSLKESKEAIRARHEAAMNEGRMRDTPGAVVAATDHLTSQLLKFATHKHAKKREIKRAFTDIAAASVVEDQLINELKNSGD